MTLSRRRLFALAGASAAGSLLADPLKILYSKAARGQAIATSGYGPLQPDPNGLLDLPSRFQYRVLSQTGTTMNDGQLVPADPDGMAAFPGPGGTTILVRNHEISPSQTSSPVVAPRSSLQYDPSCKGGTTTLIVGTARQLVRQYTSLAGTYRNCAGGATPWGSWISCEENTSTPAGNAAGDPNNVSMPHGYNFEVPSIRPLENATPLVAMGRFNHEAIAVDPTTGIVYQTEDRGDSLFYRFIPNQPGNLQAGGVLEALKIQNMPQAITKTNFPVNTMMLVEWVRIEQVNPPEDTVRVEGFAKGAAQFSRGEGIVYSNGALYFTCTNGGTTDSGQIWRYVPGSTPAEGGTIELFIEPNNPSVLDMPDNLVMAPFGDLILCEDGGGEQFLVGVTPTGQLYPFARNALNTSEFAGACFSPDGRTMFVNIYSPGITVAIWGPWGIRG